MNDLLVMKRTSFEGEELDALVIQNKYVKDDDWDRIISFMHSCSNIYCLELSGISITASGLKFLTVIVKSNTNLKELKLEWNNFTETSSEFDQLIDGIIQSNILCLYLNNNKIGGNTLIHSICKLLKHSSSLAYLDLRWNEISDDGGRKILESMSKNTNIQVLNLIGNKVTNYGILKQITETLDRNKQYQINNSKPKQTSTSFYQSDKKSRL